MESQERETSDLVWEYIGSGAEDATVEELSKLALSPCEKVRVRVARNPNTSTSDLKRLSVDSEFKVKATVAGNPNTPQSFIWEMIEKGDSLTRLALAESINTPKAMLQRLSADSCPTIALSARHTLIESRRNGNTVVCECRWHPPRRRHRQWIGFNRSCR